MLKDITIGQYYRADSFIHKLDPRSKIIGIILIMIGLFVANRWYGMTFMGAVIFGILLLSKVPLKFFIKGLKPLIVIILFTAIVQMLWTPGEYLWRWHFLHISREGLHLAFFMCSRLVLLVLGSSILTYTTTPMALTDAIENLLSPLKRFGFPAHELAMMMSIALRFIPTLIDETDKIMKAQSARGAVFDEGNIIKRAQALLPVLVPLFFSAIKRADELSMAMEARCYHGGDNRTRLFELSYQKRDVFSIMIIVLVVFVVAGLRKVAL